MVHPNMAFRKQNKSEDALQLLMKTSEDLRSSYVKLACRTGRRNLFFRFRVTN